MFCRSSVVYFVALVLCASSLASDDAQTLIVRGDSMSLAFESGEEVTLLAIAGIDLLEREAVVAVQFNSRKNKMLKRIYSLPGDKVAIQEGQFYLNGKQKSPFGWPEAFRIDEKKVIALAAQLRRSGGVIPRESYLVLGDNPLNSFDSLDYGFVARSQIIALAE